MSDAQKLLPAAETASRSAHAPYSRFYVGAALEAEDGRIFLGANVENATYGLTICAERVAVASAVVAGARRFRALAVWSPAGVTPCGLCRQTLIEFAQDLDIAIGGPGRAPRSLRLAALLPEAFSPADLGVAEGSA